MKLHIWIMLLCVSILAACSEGKMEQESDKANEPNQQSLSEVEQVDELTNAKAVDADCPGFEALFALLPDQLNGEEISEQYFSCDQVTPKANSHFISKDQSTSWRFSVMSREIDSPFAQLRWDIANTDEPQKKFLRRMVNTTIDAEVLLFKNCVNNLQLMGLPDWGKTSQVNVGQHDVCIGTDAQLIEDRGWVARATSPQYLYTLEIEGEKATQFDNAEAAAGYVETLFRQFR